MSLKSLDELRGWIVATMDYGLGPDGTNLERLHDIADAIESEVAERYVELPADADGEVIKPGDTLAVKGKAHIIENVALYRASNGRWAIGAHRPDELVHFKPRTIEDVLLDAGVSRACVEDVAAELRELMGGAE